MLEITPPRVDHSQSQDQASAPVKSEKDKDNPQAQPVDPMVLAWMCIYESVQISNQTARIQAKVLEVNADAQQKLIQQEQNIAFNTLRASQFFTKQKDWHNQYVGPQFGQRFGHFTWKATYKLVSKKPSAVDLYKVEAANQRVGAARGVIGDNLSLMRQSGQIAETNLQTTVNESQQAVQEDGSLAQMLVSLTNQITRI